MKLTFIIFCLFSSLTVCLCNDKVKLRDVKTLTLYLNRKTNGRRSPGVPQLECVGGTANCAHKYIPNVVQCSNEGLDEYDVQWTCKADLESTVKFGHIDVNCEGYDFPNDKYILKGSCGLRYTLDKSHSDNTYKENYSNRNKINSSNNGMTNIMVIILIVVVVIIIICWYNSNSTSQTSPRVEPNPPPPGFRPEYTASAPPFSSSYTDPPPYSSVFNEQKFSGQQRNDGPGFWTGLGTGGIMGYLFGSTNNRRQGYEHMSSYEPRYSTTTDDYRPSHNRRDSPEFRTASGFGSTSRR